MNVAEHWCGCGFVDSRNSDFLVRISVIETFGSALELFGLVVCIIVSSTVPNEAKCSDQSSGMV